MSFEKKRLPVVVLRRILGSLVMKSRKRANTPDRPRWGMNDLLFVSAYGDEVSEQREIAFAHFSQSDGDLPTLRVLGWDGADTGLKLEHVARSLEEKLRWPSNPGDADTWRQQWSSAFRHRLGHIVKTSDHLAEAMAGLARSIRDATRKLLEAESERGPLTKLFKAFQAALIHDLTEEKFAFLRAHTAPKTSLGGKLHCPCAPYYYFAASATAQDISEEYQRWPDLPAIFGTGNRQADKEVFWATGFASQQDELAMSFTRDELEKKVAALASSRSFDELQESYRLCTTNQWDYGEAKDFAKRGLWKQHVGQVAYGPFDRQWSVMHKHVLTILRKQVMSQLGGNEKNLGLISSRAVNDLNFGGLLSVGATEVLRAAGACHHG